MNQPIYLRLPDMLNEHLEHRVNQRLLRSNDLSSTPIEVVADRSTVTLSGEVQSFRRKLKAEEVAQACPGVEVVVNRLTVVGSEFPSNRNMLLKVYKALEQAGGLPVESMQLETREGRVTVSGYIANNEGWRRVNDVIFSVAGVREVTNRLIINPDKTLTNVELARSIHAALGQEYGIDHRRWGIAVVDQTATVYGRTDASWKRETAEGILRTFGILKIDDQVIECDND